VSRKYQHQITLFSFNLLVERATVVVVAVDAKLDVYIYHTHTHITCQKYVLV